MIRVKKHEFVKARIKAGYSQRGLGRALGKSSAYVSLIENGQITPSPRSAKQICELLNADFDRLFEIVPFVSKSSTA